MKKILCAVFVLAFLATSCTIGRKKINTAADVVKDQVMIVGKIVYDQPMTADTQLIQILGWDSLRYKTFMICGPQLKVIEKEAVFPMSAELSDSIETTQGEYFYSQNKPAPFYFIGGIFYKEIYGDGDASVYNGVLVPASFYIDIRPSDVNRAVYVGTIKYTRNNFWNITRIQILDEAKELGPIFAKKFPGMKIRKALIRQPGPGVVPRVGSPY